MRIILICIKISPNDGQAIQRHEKPLQFCRPCQPLRGSDCCLRGYSSAGRRPAANRQLIDTVTIIGHASDVADVPGSAHVINSEELDVFIETDILRMLRSVPGVYVQEEEGFGLRPNIGIRGSGLDRSARIALLEDGVLIAPAPYSAPSAYYFPTPRRMHALEVLKGPAAVIVGPRTTGGAINMISTPIPNAAGGRIDLRIGEHNTNDAHLNFGSRGERVSWLLETVQSASDGFKHIDGPVGGNTGFALEDYVAKLYIRACDSRLAIRSKHQTKPISA